MVAVVEKSEVGKRRELQCVDGLLPDVQCTCVVCCAVWVMSMRGL